MLLKIKEFADFCSISVRALHLYDRLGLFHPMKTESNGYRYYDTEQMRELNTIISFKKVGFSLKEIKEMKDKNYTQGDVAEQLHKKLEENMKQIQILSYDNDNIEVMLQSLCCHKDYQDENKNAQLVSKIACLENEKLEHDFSQIIWL